MEHTLTYTMCQGGGNIIWRDDHQGRITVKTIVSSDIAIQFNALFAVNPISPLI